MIKREVKKKEEEEVSLLDKDKIDEISKQKLELLADHLRVVQQKNELARLKIKDCQEQLLRTNVKISHCNATIYFCYIFIFLMVIFIFSQFAKQYNANSESSMIGSLFH